MNLKEIIENVPDNLNQMEKARYIYINLCKQVSYNQNYLITSSLAEKKKIFDEEVQIEKWTKNEIICSTISKIYAALLNKIGIEADIMHVESDEYLGHVFVWFKDKNKRYYADPTFDILKVKKGMRTREFATVNDFVERDDYEILPFEELKKIDDLIGYTYNGLYMDDFIDQIKFKIREINFNKPERKINETDEEFQIKINEYNAKMEEYKQIFDTQNLDKEKILDYKIKLISKAFDSSNLDAVDKHTYFFNILLNCINFEESIKHDMQSLKCAENNEIRIFTVITNKETSEKSIYTFSNQDFAVPVDEYYIKDKILTGMTTLSDRKENKEMLMNLAEIRDKNETQKSSMEDSER